MPARQPITTQTKQLLRLCIMNNRLQLVFMRASRIFLKPFFQTCKPHLESLHLTATTWQCSDITQYGFVQTKTRCSTQSQNNDNRRVCPSFLCVTHSSNHIQKEICLTLQLSCSSFQLFFFYFKDVLILRSTRKQKQPQSSVNINPTDMK